MGSTTAPANRVNKTVNEISESVRSLSDDLKINSTLTTLDLCGLSKQTR